MKRKSNYLREINTLKFKRNVKQMLKEYIVIIYTNEIEYVQVNVGYEIVNVIKSKQ